MAVSDRLALAIALVVGLWAQLGNATEVWAIVAYVNNGERTPLVDAPDTILTPEGAQQMLRQGKAFRARYLANVSDSDYDHIGAERIQNMNDDMIDNTVLDVTSRTDEYINGGAMAFLQGLYPPSFKAYESSSDDWDIAHDYTEDNDTLVDYPLNGYQYANVRTLGMLDPTSTNIQGNLRCSAWESETTTNLTEDPTLQTFYNATLEFYQLLFSTTPLAGTVDLADANLWNAYEIYDYVNYMYIHNETVYKGLSNNTDALVMLDSYATTMERAKNAYINGTGDSEDSAEKEILYSIAGRTLANRVARQLINNLQWNGDRDKMALMFGSYEPILAFTAMAGILNGDTITEGPFSQFPKPGAAMIFELIGEDPDDPNTMPSFDDLEVRFLYRANADSDADFVLYPLFGLNPENGTIPFATFIQVMQDFGVSSYEWCDICGPNPAPWCANAYYYNDPSSTSHLDPVVAGVLGAVIMGAIVGVIGLLLFCLGGLRLHRRVKEEPTNTTGGTTAGGFKGPEKKDDDKDVAVTKNGVQHERVGSWELKDGTTLPTVQTVGVTSEPSPAEQRRRSFESDGDDISVMGATPVKAHESV